VRRKAEGIAANPMGARLYQSSEKKEDYLLPVLLSFVGILRSAFFLLRSLLGEAKLMDLRREC
jgi:hypothetical protein